MEPHIYTVDWSTFVGRITSILASVSLVPKQVSEHMYIFVIKTRPIRDFNREWALLLPAYSIMLVLLTYFTVWALALSRTPALSSLQAMTGENLLELSYNESFIN